MKDRIKKFICQKKKVTFPKEKNKKILINNNNMIILQNDRMHVRKQLTPLTH